MMITNVEKQNKKKIMEKKRKKNLTISLFVPIRYDICLFLFLLFVRVHFKCIDDDDDDDDYNLLLEQ